jgi:hypothetical protein
VVAVQDEELLSFIDSVYREPYSLLKNNCIHKSVRIQRKARERGKAADLITCVSLVKMKWLYGLPTLNPHMYAVIDGEKVDVSLDPGHEARYCRNTEKKLLFPVNISGIGRRIRRKADGKA